MPPVVLLVLGGWLLLQHHGFWYDELYTAEVAAEPAGTIVEAMVRGEGTIDYLRDAPPSYNGPYYLAAHLWLLITGLDADEWGLRLLSLVATAGAMLAFTLAVTRLAGTRVGVVAGVVAACNPFVVHYAVEARGYGLALLATALAGLGLAWWLDGRPRAPLLYGLAGAAAGLAHWFALLVLVAFAVAALVLRGCRAAWPLLAVTAASTLPVIGLVTVALVNGVGASGAEWIQSVGAAAPKEVLDAWTSGHALLLVVTAAAVTAALVAPPAGTRRARVVAILWLGLPVAVVAALELVRPVFVPRYLLPATLGLAALMAVGLTRWPHRVSALATVVVVGVSLWATVAQLRLGPTENVRGAVEAVAAIHRPGEPVVAAARWDALGVDHYARREHPALVDDLVLPPAAVPSAPTVWVVRRSIAGVKGDPAKLAALDTELHNQGMRLAAQDRFTGRVADVLVQRWECAPTHAVLACETAP